MKRLICAILALGLAAGAMAGCSEEDLAKELVDGTYRAEFRDFDPNHWKDFVEVTVKDGDLYEVVFDAEYEDGSKLKSEDEGYKNDMENIMGTYPAKYSQDLINQFIRNGGVNGIDTVAGATQSTNNFKALVIAAVENAVTGDTETEVIERPDKN